MIALSDAGFQFSDGSVLGSAKYQYGFKNRFINGAMQINQRGASSIATSGYLVDRWALGTTNGFTSSGLVTDGTVSLVGNNHVYLQANTTLASPAIGDYSYLFQRIEGYNMADFLFGKATAKPITLSFRANASVSSVVSIAFRNGSSTRSYVTTVTLTPAVNKYTITIFGDTTGTWAVDNTQGMEVGFVFSANTPSGTFTTPNANVWQAGAFIAHTSQSNGLDTLNRYIDIADVQLELGSIATPYEFRPVMTELSLSQRYYEIGIARLDGYNSAGNVISSWSNYKVQKRVTPTITFNNTGYANASSVGTDFGSTVHGLIIKVNTLATGGVAYTTTWVSDAEI